MDGQAAAEPTPYLIIPVILIALIALAGAVSMGRSFGSSKYRVPLVVGGALAGGIGSILLMIPLNFCTFEAERTAADIIFGGILMITTGMGLITLVRWLSSVIIMRRSMVEGQATQGTFKGWLLPAVLLAPTIGILALFLYYPSLETFRLSTLLARLGAPRTRFICVDNFTSLVNDPAYFKAVFVTFVISAAVVIIGLSLSLLVATMAYQPIKGARIYRTLLIWPYAISPVVAGIIFLLFFNPTGGILNYWLRNLFGISIGWLNQPVPAVAAVIIASVWKSMGFNILFYIAGLQNVPSDLKEAAAIDGANALQRFRHVVIPLLSPITFFLIITNLTYAFFETFGTIDALTGPGPLQSTTTMMYRIYQVGVVGNDLGKGAAQSIILFVVVIALTIYQFRTTARRVTYGA